MSAYEKLQILDLGMILFLNDKQKIYSVRAPRFTVTLPSFSHSIACFLIPHDSSDTKL